MERRNEETLKTHLRHVVKEARMANKLTQAECARRMGIARQTYLDFENAKTLPKVDLIYDFAELTQRSLSYFLPPLGVTLEGHILVKSETWEKMSQLNEELRTCLAR
ncbi:helix-turn-helix transcriptional regulator [Grimontia sp. NTOU-MAR1]|uniref:helix-turn-helix transcriptional regulator n=1 Tax=Grimontia sp. NTOU-MAR1 TaxID=3111011 RepID=UPI002DBA1633|nr:helix-turn-helix transcriptional regulator [Grimontia sp. NTOU-MAR1]WRV96404.1 helix-turn-helix transcriptional regulator [Grimontia sp. NTOU-MAR1]